MILDPVSTFGLFMCNDILYGATWQEVRDTIHRGSAFREWTGIPCVRCGKPIGFHYTDYLHQVYDVATGEDSTLGNLWCSFETMQSYYSNNPLNRVRLALIEIERI